MLHRTRTRTRLTVPLTLFILLAALTWPSVRDDARAAGVDGLGVTQIMAVNVGPAPVSDPLSLRRHDLDESIVADWGGAIEPDRAGTIFLPSVPGLVEGYHAARPAANGTLALNGYTTWWRADRTDWTGARATLNGSAAATDLSLPWVRFTPTGPNGYVSIQNVDQAAPAHVHLSLVGSGPSGPTADIDLPPGGTTTVDLRAQFGTMPSGVDSVAARLTADRPVAASVILTADAAAEAVAGYSAVALAEAGGDAILPYLPTGSDGSGEVTRRSVLAVHNLDDVERTFEVRLVGASGACMGVQDSRTPAVPANGAVAIDIATVAGALGANCVVAARVVAHPGVHLASAGIVWGRDGDGGIRTFSAYEARPASAARSDLVVPAFVAAYGRLSASRLWLFNPGKLAATATIQLLDHEYHAVPCPTTCQVTVPPEGAAMFGDLPDDGSIVGRHPEVAAVTADQPLLVAAVDPRLAMADDAISFASGDADAPRRWLPFAGHFGRFGPLPTPPSVPTPSPHAWPTPRPAEGLDATGASAVHAYNPTSIEQPWQPHVYPPAGEPIVPTPDAMPTQSIRSLYLPSMRIVPRGAHALRMDAPALTALTTTSWNGTNALVSGDAPTAADEVWVPLSGASDQATVVRVMNPSATDAVTVTLRADGMADRSDVLGPGRYVTLRAPDQARALRANGTGPIVAGALTFIAPSGRPAYDSLGQPSPEGPADLWVARAYRAAPMPGTIGILRTTRLLVVNPSGQPIDATASLTGEGGTCDGQSFSVAASGIPASDGATLDLGGVGGVPDGCEGAVRVHAVGPLVVTAVDIYSKDDATVAAAAVPARPARAMTARRLIFPLRYGQGPGRWSSDVVVTNPGPAARTVTLAFDMSMSGSAVAPNVPPFALAPGASRVLGAGVALNALSGEFAVGHLSADGPILARIDQYTLTGSADVSADLGAPDGETPASDADSGAVLWALSDAALGPAAESPAAPEPQGPASPDPLPSTLFALAFVDVAGGGPGCAACDGAYDAADREAARLTPLPRLTFTVRDASGATVATGQSRPYDGVQAVALDVPQRVLTSGATVTIETLPSGWSYCPNAPLVRPLTADDFRLGVGRADFHLSNTCAPSGALPPLVRGPLPPLDGAARQRIFVPFVNRPAR